MALDETDVNRTTVLTGAIAVRAGESTERGLRSECMRRL